MIAKQDIQKLADDIGSAFHPERIILFGSHAYGEPQEYSDVDLLVITNHEGRGRDLRSLIHRTVGYRFPTDIVVRSPEDVERRYRGHDPLIREAVDKGKVLYERHRVGVGIEG